MKKMTLTKMIKKIMKRKGKRKKEHNRPNKAGTKLARRMLSRQIRAEKRDLSIHRNAGTATQPGTLQGGFAIPWRAF